MLVLPQQKGEKMNTRIMPKLDNGLADAFIATAKKTVSPYESFVSGSALSEFSAKHPIAQKVENGFNELAQATYAQRADSYALSHDAVGSKLNIIAG